MATAENVILFEPHLRERQRKARLEDVLTKQITKSGWTLAGQEKAPSSDVCVYLLDSDNDAAVAFGTSFATIAACHAGEWTDLVNAWEVIADPDLPCDMAHIEVTAELAQRAILSARLMPNLSVPEGQRLHLILVINREDLTQPCAVVPAVSDAPILNATSVQVIVKSWMDQT